MMIVCLDAVVSASVPAAAGSGGAADGLPVALAFEHAHEWIQDGGLIGLFHCADPACDGHAVCPGCLPHPVVVLAASAAGFVVYRCVLHCEPRIRKGAAR